MRGFAIALAAALCLAASAAAEEAKELSFGVIATDSSAAIRERYLPLFRDMEQGIGMKVSFYYASDYAGMIQAMRFNKVQMARFGNKSAAEAVDRSEGEVAFRSVDLDGSMGYHSVIIVHRDSALRSVEDVLREGPKLSFGAGDPNSTSGTLVPGYHVFAKNGIDPKTFFKRVVAANHEINGLAVATKQVDVATNNDVALRRLARSATDKHALLRVIWTSPLIPSDPLVWRQDLPAALKQKIADFLLAYGAEGPEDRVAHEREVLRGLGWQRIVRSSNEQLVPTRRIDLFAERLKVEREEGLAAEEKTRRLAELDERLRQLGD